MGFNSVNDASSMENVFKDCNRRLAKNLSSIFNETEAKELGLVGVKAQDDEMADDIESDPEMFEEVGPGGQGVLGLDFMLQSGPGESSKQQAQMDNLVVEAKPKAALIVVADSRPIKEVMLVRKMDNLVIRAALW